MNKIVVGNAPSPNLVTAQSRIGSLSNTQHKVKEKKTFLKIRLDFIFFPARRGKSKN